MFSSSFSFRTDARCVSVDLVGGVNSTDGIDYKKERECHALI